MGTQDSKKAFKYWRSCKNPECRREFGTNRKWQEFCPKPPSETIGCQQRYHQLLRRKHEDVVVELAALKEAFIKMAETQTKLIICMTDFIEAISTLAKKTGTIQNMPAFKELTELKGPAVIEMNVKRGDRPKMKRSHIT